MKREKANKNILATYRFKESYPIIYIGKSKT